MQTEIWKDVIGYEIKYSISSTGKVLVKKSGLILKPILDKYGYYRINLFACGKHKSYFIHRLVGIAFIPNPENKPQINHKNSIRTDNMVNNLEWCTGKENIIHSFRRQRKTNPTHGEAVTGSKLNSEQVLQIRAKRNEGATLILLAKEYTVSLSTIYNITIGKKWKHIADN